MRIVDRKTFLALPSGTVFVKFPAQPIDGSRLELDPEAILQIKWETFASTDFVCQDLIPYPDGWKDSSDVFDNQIAMLRGEVGKPADYDCVGRDGLFDQDQLFLVWDTDTHRKLIDLLQLALDTQTRATD